MKKTASNPINYIAGALWAYFVIEAVIGLIRFPGGLNMGVIVEIIGMILIAAALFTKTKYPLAAVGYSMLTVLSLANLIRQFVYIFDGASPGIYLVNSLLRIVGCAFAAAIIAAQLLSREQWGRTLKGLWFIPVIMFAISTLILLITTLINFGFDMSIRYYIDRILSIAADVLTLLWYAIGIDGSSQNAYNTGNPRIGYGPNGARPYPQGGGQYPQGGGQYPRGGQQPQGGGNNPAGRGYNPNGGGYNPNGGGYGQQPQGGGQYPQGGGQQPQGGGQYPQAGSQYPAVRGYSPNGGGYNPNNGGYGQQPQGGGQYPAGRGYNPNGGGYNPNSGEYDHQPQGGSPNPEDGFEDNTVAGNE